jgi:hypothetical protein
MDFKTPINFVMSQLVSSTRFAGAVILKQIAIATELILPSNLKSKFVTPTTEPQTWTTHFRPLLSLQPCHPSAISF